MKRITGMIILLLCLCLTLPVFAETPAGNEKPEYFAPATFAQMYNSMASAAADQYYTNLGEDTLAQIKEDCLFAEEDVNGQILYLDSATYAVEASFAYENEDFTDGDPAILWNFHISRNLSGEAINLAAYTLKMMIGYTYQDTVSMSELSDWFNKLAGPDDGFELPGYTLSMVVSEDYITYMMLPPADSNPILQQNSAGDNAALQEEIRFLNLPWGCDIETARVLMESSGLLTEEAEGRFEMTQRHLDVMRNMKGRDGSEISYTSFVRTDNGYTVNYEDEAANVVEVHLMSDMVKPYLGREVHHITMTFLVEDDTEKLLNVNVSYMISDVDVLPELIKAYGEPQLTADSDYGGRIWIGENETGLLWSDTFINYGMLNAQELVLGGA